MRLTPTTPRELGINYSSQWEDKFVQLTANPDYPWIVEGYPYSTADQRAFDFFMTGIGSDALVTFDGDPIVTLDGFQIVAGGNI